MIRQLDMKGILTADLFTPNCTGEFRPSSQASQTGGI